MSPMRYVSFTDIRLISSGTFLHEKRDANTKTSHKTSHKIFPYINGFRVFVPFVPFLFIHIYVKNKNRYIKVLKKRGQKRDTLL